MDKNNSELKIKKKKKLNIFSIYNSPLIEAFKNGVFIIDSFFFYFFFFYNFFRFHFVIKNIYIFNEIFN